MEPAWDERGLVPAVVQDATTGTVLMMAWMNREALALTRSTGDAHFWSRSRQAMWKKGETSGNTLRVVEIRVDCDADTLLVRAHPAGPACHTGKTACFYRVMAADGADAAVAREDEGVPAAAAAPDAAAADILGALEQVLIARRDHATGEKSYTRSLLDAGFPKILAKIAEEHGELADELPAGPDDAVVHEAADLWFHVMVGLVARGIPVDRIWQELGRRFGVGGHVEKASR
ncbi:MAG: bifunctional phosphoribosyl-AMP cyclohydrolase/phosphoribosyl-ATP diphosphatase HisIE [Kofleriaceae bacterium]|nr:bifunctional phosphoribosyl-AMP cyclohydrolase/phosphoribosyl-ATP diphosphatase HisIE [Myxococcales bacterium]MCB9559515.1 bifunctional phosphoribosyl-AMP cyclohydrolase/phosphoribosyl-ATP diphosphatase HisIE [Kofleriaceae bacterium]MCB9574974.1 bifunctional phosphoribosyl-AMP cyclohydrolase/phosphoribosyl-ATP diphosphatase HisIE [Kofleriaceae bacterium]